MNEAKVLLIFLGLGIFIWGIIIPNWIRMIGGFAMLFLGALITSD